MAICTNTSGRDLRPEFPFEFESVIDISEPWACRKLSEFYGAYFCQVRDVLSQLTVDDTLFLVSCGPGSERGPLLIGNEDSYFDLWPGSLAMAVERCKAKVQLIVPARRPRWVNSHWRLPTVGTFTQHQYFHNLSWRRLSTSSDSPMPEEGEVELIHLAQKHLHFLLPLTLSEANFASKCTVLVKPCRPLCRPLTNEDKVKILDALKKQATLRFMHSTLPKNWVFKLSSTRLEICWRSIWGAHVPMIDILWMGWLARIWEDSEEACRSFLIRHHNRF